MQTHAYCLHLPTLVLLEGLPVSDPLQNIHPVLLKYLFESKLISTEKAKWFYATSTSKGAPLSSLHWNRLAPFPPGGSLLKMRFCLHIFMRWIFLHVKTCLILSLITTKFQRHYSVFKQLSLLFSHCNFPGSWTHHIYKYDDSKICDPTCTDQALPWTSRGSPEFGYYVLRSFEEDFIT